MAERLRLFVALELPAVAREALAAFRDAVDPVVWRPVRDEALHVTLAFLGARGAQDVAVVSDVLARCAGAAPSLTLGGALLLPPRRRARVLCAEVADPSGELGALQARVAAALVEAGVYAAEQRPFRAHATVARLRPGARPPREPPSAGPAAVAFRGEWLTLFHSRPARGGSGYEPLARVPLERP